MPMIGTKIKPFWCRSYVKDRAAELDTEENGTEILMF